MLSKTIKAMRRRAGPVGLSLAAAALTAVAFAAVSVAAKDDGSKAEKSGEAQGGDRTFERPAGPPRTEDLSAEDQQALEEFKACMEENGAPAPPEPGEFDRDNPPEPPSEADRAKIEKAMEACEDKLPEGARGHFGGPPCGPPPGGGEQGTAPAPPPGNRSQQGDTQSAPQGAAA